MLLKDAYEKTCETYIVEKEMRDDLPLMVEGVSWSARARIVYFRKKLLLIAGNALEFHILDKMILLSHVKFFLSHDILTSTMYLN